MPNLVNKKLVLAVAMTMPGVAFSQALEEVVVTAQKRAQSLQDVPIAVSALSGDWMKQNNIADLEDVAALVPNLSLSGTPGINTVRIRGLGTGGGNSAFEQSVGMYVDGIYAGRGYQFSLPYLDVERIEVLKGPQGVLFGKNSIAGAISITSARPSPEFEGEIGLSYEAENDGYSVEAVINGELMPGLSGRLAASYIEEGGWIDNTLLNDDDQPEVEMGGYRASLLWEASDTVEVYFKYDHGEYEKDGSEMGIKHIVPGSTNPFMPGNPTWLSLYQAADPDVGLIEDQLQSAGASLTDEPDGYSTDVDSDAFTLQVDWELGDHTLTSLSGYSTYDVDTFSDQSFSPLTIINQHGKEEFDQFTQEIRLTSPVGEQFEYIVGLFYMDRTLEFPARYTDLEFTELFGPTLPAPAPPLPTALVGASSLKQYDEDTESISVFGQLTWNISDVLRTSLGLRYSHEEKQGDHKHVLYELGTTEDNVDPSLNIQWDVNNDLMVYAAATKATKAGGYNAGDLSGDPNRIEFEPEEATGYEVGAKGEFLDNRLRVNVAAFYTEFDDLQVSALDGNSGGSKGLEIDAIYLLNEAITLGGALAYLDSTFDDFPGAPCANSIYRQDDCVGEGPGSSRVTPRVRPCRFPRSGQAISTSIIPLALPKIQYWVCAWMPCMSMILARVLPTLTPSARILM
jgi:outer membrane receptor protein involved in Fe transport